MDRPLSEQHPDTSAEEAPARYARLEATAFGLALVVDEPICDEATARWLFDDIARQLREIEAGRRGKS